MKFKPFTIVLLLLTSTVFAPMSPAAPGNEAPLAEAGLDQGVSKGTTVLLDATESRDPDGTIDQYTWSIETPDSQTIAPDCPDCARTQFVASQVGTYNVTITVTDNDGATSSDTLYVEVSPGAGPQVSVSGPTSPTVGETGTYTASIDAGAADLSEVQWFVDGKRVATHQVAGQSQLDSLDRTFPTADSHTITAIVVDKDDQRASDSLSIQVDAADGGGGDGETPTLASQGSPTIHGPREVLGTQPLGGSYSASLDLDPRNVAGIEWFANGESVGSSIAEEVIWTPGDHQLFAVVTYTDSSSAVAKFPDGTTTVIADPQPSVVIGEISDIGEIAGRATASDEYGNLRSLTVFVDGEQVAQTAIDPLQLRKNGGAGELATSYAFEDITPEEPHTVRVVATDVRGQSSEQTQTVTPTGEPEIVRAEFVNTPVDSYHDRINASRYAAHHVLEIDLNGVDPEKLRTEFDLVTPGTARMLNSSKYSVKRGLKGDHLLVHSYWTAESPGEYLIEATWSIGEVNKSEMLRSEFSVTPSHPELRYEVTNGGRVDYVPDWGLVVDASESFDPDGTNITYFWTIGAETIETSDPIRKYDSFKNGSLTIQDGYDLYTTNTENFLHYFNPGVNRTDELTTGPYKPNETVRFRVFSRPYKLSKVSYEVKLGLGVPYPAGRVDAWEEVRIDNGECKSGPCNYRLKPSEELDIDNRRYRYYVGTVELPARAFANGTFDPTIATYTQEHPAQTKVEYDLPAVNVFTKGGQYWENVTILDLEYTVETPDYKWQIVSNESVRDAYLAQNYTIAKTDATLAYVVDHQVKTQDAVFETERLSFQQRGTMQTFLAENPNWYDAGTSTTTRTYTTTETEWRDSRSGNGTYTEKTREKLVRAAQYKLERKYTYDYQVEKAGTKTVTRTKYRWVQKTGTRTVTKCNSYIGCYESTETYTYWTKEAYTYTTTKTYTYYVTETATYWAAGRRHPDHEFTGESRQIQLSPAEYKTQYEYEFEVDHTVTVYQYLAARQVEVQPPIYEWQEHTVTTDKLAAQTMANRGADWRIGTTRTTPEWTLKKYNGTRTYVENTIPQNDQVVQTRAMVDGILIQKYLNTATGETIEEELGRSAMEFTSDRTLTSDEIKEILGDNELTEYEDINWCDLKNTCQ